MSSVSKNELTGSPTRVPSFVSPCSWSMNWYFSYDFANLRICSVVSGGSPFIQSQSFAPGIITGAVSRIVPSFSVFIVFIKHQFPKADYTRLLWAFLIYTQSSLKKNKRDGKHR